MPNNAAGSTSSTSSAVAIVSPAPITSPVAHGYGRLQQALETRGWRCVHLSSLPDDASEVSAVLVLSLGTGTAGSGSGAPAYCTASASAVSAAAAVSAVPAWLEQATARAGFALPSQTEALGFCPIPAQAGRPPVVVIAGADPRGLVYALLEAARRIELAGETLAGGPEALISLFPQLTEAPERALRSVCIFPHHEALDAEWYRSLDFWAWYFDLLALHRFNRFVLTYGHQTAYMAPPYPYFVEVPEHPEVTVPSLSTAQREANLALLQAIGRLAVERGLDFGLGVWSQHAYSYGASAVNGLNEHNLAAYCGAGMHWLVAACPDISSVQLRVNAESGVHLDEGGKFWRSIFDGVAACGRPILLDLRAKGLTEDTIDAGIATGLPVVVDTKFWTEHHGLPYHATLLQEGDRYVKRHSYGDQLYYPRRYDFLFQLWNLGTNRFLLWADPDWVRQFSASSTLGDAVGFEVCAPLSNKGFGHRGGVWRIFDDPAYEFYQWEQQRYWYWYALFGRLGYSGGADPSVWGREWSARFGEQAAPYVQQALAAASEFLPLITACHSPSASVFGYWPEKDMGGLLDLYLQVPGSDVGMFASALETVTSLMAARPEARRTPAQLSEHFLDLAARAEAALTTAQEMARPENDAAQRELRSLSLDVRVQAELARYHAAKLRAAEHLTWFYASGDVDALLAAGPDALAALAAWERVCALTDGVYHDDLIFGRPKDQDGHWKDNLPYARHDVARLQEAEDVFRRYGLFDYGFDFGAQLPVRTGTPPLPYLHDYAVERRFTGVGPQSLYTPQTGWGWGGTYGLVAREAPKMSGQTLRASAPGPAALPKEALYVDYVARNPAAPYDNGTFLVDVPNGDYEITVILADRSAEPVTHGPMSVNLQGRHTLGPVTVPAGEIVELRQRVTITQDRLDLEAIAPPQGDWLITGLVITRVAPHFGHRPPACARPGEALALRATVTGPEALRRVSAFVRYGSDGPYTEFPLLAAGSASGPEGTQGSTPGRYATHINVPASATGLDYYLEAEDAQGTVTTWPAAGVSAPHRLAVGAATTPPQVEHTPILCADPGQPLEIRARISAAAPLQRVTLHYRNVNQMHTHDRLPMLPARQAAPDAPVAGSGESSEFVATIPGAHITTRWDVMYHLEVVDALGNAAFHPGLAAGTPYVVTRVRR